MGSAELVACAAAQVHGCCSGSMRSEGAAAGSLPRRPPRPRLRSFLLLLPRLWLRLGSRCQALRPLLGLCCEDYCCCCCRAAAPAREELGVKWCCSTSAQ
jgi:hypothetical protein